MKNRTINTLKLAVVFVVLVAMFGAGFNSSVAYAAACTPTVTLDLYAKTGSAILFGATSSTIWGYATNSGDPATLPGPVLDVNQGDCIGVTLHNVDIPGNTSLLFQGQEMIPDTIGVVAGGSKSYIFSASSAGTFLYEAGLIPGAQHQVAMGMYGALIVHPSTTGQAYNDASTAYDSEAVLVLSEVDPALNASVTPAAFDMRKFNPKYFLINGKAYPGTAPLAGNPGERVLLRYVNAGLQAHAMSTLGLSQTIIAQDGEAYQYSHNMIAETIATGQTLDTLITVPGSALEGDMFAVYDANMLLRNATAAGFGGMMTFLTVGSGTPPPPPDAGPTVSGLSLSPNPTDGSVDVTVSATLTDSGASATNIQAAEFYIDGTASSPNAMTGAFGTATSISVSGTIDVATLAGLSSGNHTIFVRGQDTIGNWGSFVSAILTLDKTGPATTNLGLNPNPSDGSVPVTLTAIGNDTATGGSNVTAAEYWVDGGAHIAMTINGAVSTITNFTATIPAGLSQGSHVVSVRSQDSFGNWGTVATITLTVGDTVGPVTSNVSASPNPTNGKTGYNTSVPAVRVFADFSDAATGGSNIATAEGFIDTVGTTGTGFVFIATDGSFNSPTESGYGDIPLAVVSALSSGNHTIYVHAKDASGNWGSNSTTILTVDKAGPTFGPISVTPPNITRLNNATVNVTVAGSVTDNISGVNPTSGTYTITDSKSNNVVNGTFTIDASGNFSFSVDISRTNNGNPNNINSRRYYTFTIYVADNLGNIGTATVQFWVQ